MPKYIQGCLVDNRHTLILTLGILVLASFSALSIFIQNTEWIWFLTRAMGLLSYAFLLISVVLGELRLLTKGRSDFWPFRYHHMVSIFSLLLIVCHFIAAFADNFKWGKQLNFTQYLGFSFSDKWLAFMSLGVLAFYLLALVGLTSSTKGLKSLGFKRWKPIHSLTYAAYFIAYIHAVNLGTDIKASSLHTVLSPMILFSFIVVLSLLITRIIDGFGLLEDPTEVAMMTMFLILLFSAAASVASQVLHNMDAASELQQRLDTAKNVDETRVVLTEALYNESNAIRHAILEVRNGQGS
jgi:DMSO/TMAO reductase YedYZ heme-binding membrane subunit